MSDIITFEALFELVRNEKTKEELIKTNPQIYEQIINYLKSKLELYKNFKSNEEEAEKIKNQINSARKLIKEWYERRERKLVLLALTKSRIKTIDESNLLPNEIILVNQLTKILDSHRQNVLANLVNLKMPLFENLKDEKSNQENSNNESKETKLETKKIEKIHEQKNETIIKEDNEKTEKLNKTNIENINEQIKQQQDKAQKEQKTENLVKIKILENLPSFFGLNFEIYGPYKANDIAELPIEIAELIIKKGKGEKITP